MDDNFIIYSTFKKRGEKKRRGEGGGEERQREKVLRYAGARQSAMLNMRYINIAVLNRQVCLYLPRQKYCTDFRYPPFLLSCIETKNIEKLE